MLLLVLIYAYACGERSSRRIERLCTTDVAFRIACAGDIPDHTVSARFRQHHADAFAGLFAQVLRLCREAGLVKLATVAIDGTKIAADASLGANRGEQALRAEAARLDQKPAARDAARDAAGDAAGEVVREILAEADAVDAAEDAEFGVARGDELPPGWNTPVGRRERIRAALDQIAAGQQAERDARAVRDAERAQADLAALAAAETALVTEIATRQARRDEWEQAWERAVAVPGTPLPRGRAPLAPQDSVVVTRARARVAKARARAEDPGTAPRPGKPTTPTAARPGRRDRHREPRANTTDPDSRIMPTRRGWVQGYNVQIAATDDQIILATTVSTNPADLVSYTRMVDAATAAAAVLGDPDGIGMLLFDAGYASEDTLPAAVDDPGPERLIALGKTRSVRAAARTRPASGPPPPDATRRQAMDHRLRTPEGAALYKRRGATVEPAIGNLKKLLDRFSRRGLAAATSEIDLAATVFNLLKIHRAATT